MAFLEMRRTVWAALLALLVAAGAGAGEQQNRLAHAQEALDAAEPGDELNQPPFRLRDRGRWEVQVAEGRVPGRHALLARQVEAGGLRITVIPAPRELGRGQVYEVAAWAKSLRLEGTLTLQYQTGVGGLSLRFSETFPLSEDFERVAFRFEVSDEPGLEESAVGSIWASPGSSVLDGEIAVVLAEWSLRAVDDAEDYIAAPTYRPDPDPVQGLDAFMERQGVKPYDLFWEDAERGVMKTRRLIYHDREHGTEVWMLGDSPTADHAGTASVWSPWNANASLLRHRAWRPRPDGTEEIRSMLFNGDFSRKQIFVGEAWPASGIRWHDREDPDLAYVFGRGIMQELNVATRETRLLAEWEQSPQERTIGLTRCNQRYFVDTPNGGVWFPYEPGEDPIGYLARYDGRPARPNPDGSPYHPVHDAENYRVWWGTVRRPSAVCTEPYPSEYGPMLRVRVGMLIDRQTGDKEWVIAPLSGDTGYLRTFMGENGRVLFPQTPEWADFRIHTADTVDEMFEIHRYYPYSSHGHQSSSPDDHFLADDGSPVRIYNLREGTRHATISLSPTGSHYHLHWRKHPRFFVGWVRGWSFRSFVCHPNANLIYQGFSDGTWQPVFNTKHRINSYYGGGDFSMLSPDATKIHGASSLTGRFRNHIAVMARPRPPRNLSWRADEGAVELSWAPSAYSRETKGYLVYRSERSGDGYALMTPEPVGGTSWRDETMDAGQDYYYVVTSLEHAGLESGYSEEVARAGVDLPDGLDAPLVAYAEAEHSIRDLATADMPGLATGRDVAGASDWYYLYRHPKMERGEAGLDVQVPADGAYHVWARIRTARPERSAWDIALGGETLSASTDSEEWTWVRATGSPVALRAGRQTAVLATSDRAAQMDLICLATDAGFAPQGPRPEDTTTPPAPEGLRAENVRERVNRLSWDEPKYPSFSHFQVYASDEPGFEPGQGTLIGSPTYGDFIDWGLRAGTEYHYAVTAVDRRGNESAPARASQATPDAEHPPFEAELAFAEAELEGAFERSEAAGLRGPEFVVPEEPEENRATWRVEIPREGEYYLWLRHLLRGTVARGGHVAQQVDVLANGQRVARLGGLTDLQADDRLIKGNYPVASRLWTWDRPGRVNLDSATLPAGEVELVLENLAPDMRYDVLYITNEPSFAPPDGRLRGN